MSIKEESVQVLVEKAASLFGKDPKELNENTRFKEDLNCKSTNIVQFSAALEDHFDNIDRIHDKVYEKVREML